MDFLINNAWAQGGAVLVLIGFFAVLFRNFLSRSKKEETAKEDRIERLEKAGMERERSLTQELNVVSTEIREAWKRTAEIESGVITTNTEALKALTEQTKSGIDLSNEISRALMKINMNLTAHRDKMETRSDSDSDKKAG